MLDRSRPPADPRQRPGSGAPCRSARPRSPQNPLRNRKLPATWRGAPKQLQELVIPFARMNVEEHGARGVGGVGDVRPAAGQSPDEKAIDGAERELALFAQARARSRHCRAATRSSSRKNRGRAGGPVRSDDHALEALLFELGAQRRGATILPDDGVVDRLARLPIPDRASFPAGWRCRAPARSEARLSDLSSASRPVSSTLRQISSGSCSTHPCRGKIWRNSCCAIATGLHVRAEHDRARRRRALIDDENASLHAAPIPAGYKIRPDDASGPVCRLDILFSPSSSPAFAPSRS